MNAMYAAIADQSIPVQTGFGNGVDRRGHAFIMEMRELYPVLGEYMRGERSTENAYNRYVQFLDSQPKKIVDMSTGEVVWK